MTIQTDSGPQTAGPQTFDTQSVFDAARATQDAALLLAQSASEAARATSAVLQDALARRPYVTLGAMAGVGFVVAGGLAAPAIRGLVRQASGLALAAAAQKVGELVLASAKAHADPRAAPPPDHDVQGSEVQPSNVQGS